ncbi:MAG: hypothetical protein OER88_10435, partial [Planctomycetota bacterium]|nr:hypothetical protein [Planctomycetota bacterium]
PNPAKDPGCRVVLESESKDPRHRLRVRLFEYGAYRDFEPSSWLDTFFGAFGGLHADAKRVDIELPGVMGGKSLAAVRFTGVRDEYPIRTDLYVMRSDRDGRIFILRIRQRGDAPTHFAPEIRKILAGFRLLDS